VLPAFSSAVAADLTEKALTSAGTHLWAQPVLLTLELVLGLGLGRGLGGEHGGAFSAHRCSATHQTLFSPNPENPGASE